MDARVRPSLQSRMVSGFRLLVRRPALQDANSVAPPEHRPQEQNGSRWIAVQYPAHLHLTVVSRLQASERTVRYRPQLLEDPIRCLEDASRFRWNYRRTSCSSSCNEAIIGFQPSELLTGPLMLYCTRDRK